jgi:uncharacterized protein
MLDGSAHAPGQPWKRGKQAIKTLWGELAWQLGGSEAFALIKDADVTGTSPGKNVLRELLETHAPCVVLIDELVAYIRQFPEGQTLSGGTYDSNLSFAQALTEAAKLVPTAIVLASLPESDVEAGSQRGVATLRALEKTFGRIQALWKPVATEEAFEIVRRRLFEAVRETKARDVVCRAFADAYVAEGSKLPSETQERRYYDRLTQASLRCCTRAFGTGPGMTNSRKYLARGLRVGKQLVREFWIPFVAALCWTLYRYHVSTERDVIFT